MARRMLKLRRAERVSMNGVLVSDVDRRSLS